MSACKGTKKRNPPVQQLLMATVADSLLYYFNVQANNIANKIVMESKHFITPLNFYFLAGNSYGE